MNDATAEVMSGSVLLMPAAEARSGSAALPSLKSTCQRQGRRHGGRLIGSRGTWH